MGALGGIDSMRVTPRRLGMMYCLPRRAISLYSVYTICPIRIINMGTSHDD